MIGLKMHSVYKYIIIKQENVSLKTNNKILSNIILRHLSYMIYDCFVKERTGCSRAAELKLHDPKKVNWNLKLNFIECPIIKHLILSPDSLWRFCPWIVCEDFVPGLFVKNVDNS